MIFMSIENSVFTKTVAIAMVVCASLAASAVSGTAQDAQWMMHAKTFTGRSEVETCRTERADAAKTARAHLGLNIKSCECVPVAVKVDGPSAGYFCRFTYEILVRKSSH